MWTRASCTCLRLGRKEPILEVANVDGLKIRKITLDGGGQLDQLIQVRGSNPGLTFDQLDLRGFLQFAVYLFNCKGTKDRPVSLLGVTTSVAQAEQPIAVKTDPSYAEPFNQHILVRGCRFEGTYTANVTPPLDPATNKDVVFTENTSASGVR